MAYTLPNGGTFAIASGYGSALTVSAITNANPAVATSTAHGLSNGDFVEVTSGWSNLTNRIVRVSGVTANTFNLEDINTTSTTLYPAGTGTGSVRKITGFTQLAQILGTATDGGEQQYATYQALEDARETRIPTTISAQGLTLTIGDDPTLPGYILAAAAAADRAQRAIKFTLANNSIVLYNGYVGLNETPSTTVNEVMSVTASISLIGAVTRYAS